jgi:TonB-dependent receptor
VRLPTADEDKRAVELDQFPAPVIESIQVSKTFTPDQQGDASGGAVDVRLKGLPNENVLQISSQLGFNTQSSGSDFLSYDGGGVGDWGLDDGGRDVQTERLGQNWDGAVGVSEADAPVDHKWSASLGGTREVADGVRLGGFLSLFYERDSGYRDNGIDDSYWVDTPGGTLVPQTFQGTPSDGDFKTGLFDIRQGTQSVQWGGLATLGVQTENHLVGLTYLYSHTAEDKATLATDTRGKEYFFPGYDVTDPTGPGNTPNERNAAPYLRTDTLEYTERTTGTLQLNGRHTLPVGGFEVGALKFAAPELSWTLADSFADLDQPDKRQFGALWLPPSRNVSPPFNLPPLWVAFKPAANFTLGNLQRIWKTIEEDSQSYSGDVELPFEQWSGDQGYFKVGLFSDKVDRAFDQDTFSNFNDNSTFPGDAGFNDPWSSHFPGGNHPITASDFDVDYDGRQDIFAYYGMLDLPLASRVSVVSGARVETTELGVVNDAEANALWYPPGSTSAQSLDPGEADVDFEQTDVLPSIGLVFEPSDKVTLRTSYSRTIARQTFKEITPILQSEFLGGPIFIGNPELEMSSLDNYDLRMDYVPREGSLLSASFFHKEIDDPIEYVQRLASINFTTAVNYPSGRLTGLELEARQTLDRFWEPLKGLAVGANATFIDSEVELSAEDRAAFSDPGIQAPMSSRDMTNAPEHLYNLYLTYDLERTRTQLGLFYTVTGDTLVAGAGESDGHFVPSVYATEFDTLNLSVTQRLGEHFKLKFQGKNLTNPEFETVYRSKYTGPDQLKTSHTAGVEFSISLTAEFSF